MLFFFLIQQYSYLVGINLPICNKNINLTITKQNSTIHYQNIGQCSNSSSINFLQNITCVAPNIQLLITFDDLIYNNTKSNFILENSIMIFQDNNKFPNFKTFELYIYNCSYVKIFHLAIVSEKYFYYFRQIIISNYSQFIMSGCIFAYQLSENQKQDIKMYNAENKIQIDKNIQYNYFQIQILRYIHENSQIKYEDLIFHGISWVFNQEDEQHEVKSYIFKNLILRSLYLSTYIIFTKSETWIDMINVSNNYVESDIIFYINGMQQVSNINLLNNTFITPHEFFEIRIYSNFSKIYNIQFSFNVFVQLSFIIRVFQFNKPKLPILFNNIAMNSNILSFWLMFCYINLPDNNLNTADLIQVLFSTLSSTKFMMSNIQIQNNQIDANILKQQVTFLIIPFFTVYQLNQLTIVNMTFINNENNLRYSFLISSQLFAIQHYHLYNIWITFRKQSVNNELFDIDLFEYTRSFSELIISNFTLTNSYLQKSLLEVSISCQRIIINKLTILNCSINNQILLFRSTLILLWINNIQIKDCTLSSQIFYLSSVKTLTYLMNVYVNNTIATFLDQLVYISSSVSYIYNHSYSNINSNSHNFLYRASLFHFTNIQKLYLNSITANFISISISLMYFQIPIQAYIITITNIHLQNIIATASSVIQSQTFSFNQGAIFKFNITSPVYFITISKSYYSRIFSQSSGCILMIKHNSLFKTNIYLVNQYLINSSSFDEGLYLYCLNQQNNLQVSIINSSFSNLNNLNLDLSIIQILGMFQLNLINISITNISRLVPLVFNGISIHILNMSILNVTVNDQILKIQSNKLYIFGISLMNSIGQSFFNLENKCIGYIKNLNIEQSNFTNNVIGISKSILLISKIELIKIKSATILKINNSNLMIINSKILNLNCTLNIFECQGSNLILGQSWISQSEVGIIINSQNCKIQLSEFLSNNVHIQTSNQLIIQSNLLLYKVLSLQFKSNVSNWLEGNLSNIISINCYFNQSETFKSFIQMLNSNCIFLNCSFTQFTQLPLSYFLQLEFTSTTNYLYLFNNYLAHFNQTPIFSNFLLSNITFIIKNNVFYDIQGSNAAIVSFIDNATFISNNYFSIILINYNSFISIQSQQAQVLYTYSLNQNLTLVFTKNYIDFKLIYQNKLYKKYIIISSPASILIQVKISQNQTSNFKLAIQNFNIVFNFPIYNFSPGQNLVIDMEFYDQYSNQVNFSEIISYNLEGVKTELPLRTKQIKTQALSQPYFPIQLNTTQLNISSTNFKINILLIYRQCMPGEYNQNLSVSDSVQNLNCKQCQDGQYSRQNNTFQCKICSTYMKCVNGSLFSLSSGFWIIEDEVYFCFNQPQNCMGKVSNSNCSPGYEGGYCEICKLKWYELSEFVCQKCSYIYIGIIVFIIQILVLSLIKGIYVLMIFEFTRILLLIKQLKLMKLIIVHKWEWIKGCLFFEIKLFRMFLMYSILICEILNYKIRGIKQIFELLDIRIILAKGIYECFGTNEDSVGWIVTFIQFWIIQALSVFFVYKLMRRKQAVVNFQSINLTAFNLNILYLLSNNSKYYIYRIIHSSHYLYPNTTTLFLSNKHIPLFILSIFTSIAFFILHYKLIRVSYINSILHPHSIFLSFDKQNKFYYFDFLLNIALLAHLAFSYFFSQPISFQYLQTQQLFPFVLIVIMHNFQIFKIDYNKHQFIRVQIFLIVYSTFVFLAYLYNQPSFIYIISTFIVFQLIYQFLHLFSLIFLLSNNIKAISQSKVKILKYVYIASRKLIGKKFVQYIPQDTLKCSQNWKQTISYTQQAKQIQTNSEEQESFMKEIEECRNFNYAELINIDQ